MLKLKYIWIIPAFLTPSIATSSYAQLDLYTPVQAGVVSFCLNNPEMRNDPNCAKYYRQHSAPANRPSSSNPRSSASNGSSRRVVAEYECSGSSRLIGTQTIVCDGKKIELPGCSSVQYKAGVYRCFRE